MIIGEMAELGLAFGRLAVADGSSLLLVGPEPEGLLQTKRQLLGAERKDVSQVCEDLSAAEADLRVYEAWLLHSLLQPSPQPLDLVINILGFHSWARPDFDPWEERGPEPDYHLSTLMGINHWCVQEMLEQGRGHILNVLSRPEPGRGPVQEMFLQTQSLLLDFAYHLNQQLKRTPVAISTLSVSGHSFTLQGEALPRHLASDLMPATASPQAIAGYGYQMVRRVA